MEPAQLSSLHNKDEPNPHHVIELIIGIVASKFLILVVVPVKNR